MAETKKGKTMSRAEVYADEAAAVRQQEFRGVKVNRVANVLAKEASRYLKVVDVFAGGSKQAGGHLNWRPEATTPPPDFGPIELPEAA